MSGRKNSNELWAALELLIPALTPSPKGGHRRAVDDRAALNGISYALQTGIPWEDLPQELGFGSGIHRALLSLTAGVICSRFVEDLC